MLGRNQSRKAWVWQTTVSSIHMVSPPFKWMRNTSNHFLHFLQKYFPLFEWPQILMDIWYPKCCISPDIYPSYDNSRCQDTRIKCHLKITISISSRICSKDSLVWISALFQSFDFMLCYNTLWCLSACVSSIPHALQSDWPKWVAPNPQKTL